MNNKCPKCGKKLSPFYFKQTCPYCNVNLLYYNMDENLKSDALKADKEVKAVWGFVKKIDKAHLVEKYCNKKNITPPWDKEIKVDEKEKEKQPL